LGVASATFLRKGTWRQSKLHGRDTFLTERNPLHFRSAGLRESQLSMNTIQPEAGRAWFRPKHERSGNPVICRAWLPGRHYPIQDVSSLEYPRFLPGVEPGRYTVRKKGCQGKPGFEAAGTCNERTKCPRLARAPVDSTIHYGQVRCTKLVGVVSQEPTVHKANMHASARLTRS